MNDPLNGRRAFFLGYTYSIYLLSYIRKEALGVKVVILIVVSSDTVAQGRREAKILGLQPTKTRAELDSSTL